MWNGMSISVILPTYRERESIGEIISGLAETGVVNEIVVVDNNAEMGTGEAIKKAREKVRDGVRVQIFREGRQGYGWACRKGLAKASGDLVILMEPDGTYEPADIFKLLAYSREFEFVLGTRNRASLIWEGSQMTWLLRFGNWLVAKFLQVLFNAPSITDVGCTMRLIRKKDLGQLLPKFQVGDSHFSPEMMAWVFKTKVPSIEVPVNFRPRVGKSHGVSNLWRATKVATKMIGTIIRVRFA